MFLEFCYIFYSPFFQTAIAVFVQLIKYGLQGKKDDLLSILYHNVSKPRFYCKNDLWKLVC
jgi:hypothetical protein